MPLFALVSGYLFYSSASRRTPGLETVTAGVIGWFIHSFWFLWAMFWCSLAVVIAEKFFRGRIAFYVLLAVISLFVPDKLNAALHSFMYPYFVAGYIWYREGFDTKVNGLSSQLKVSSSIAVIAAW